VALRPRLSPGVPLSVRRTWPTLGFGTAPVKIDLETGSGHPCSRSKPAASRVRACCLEGVTRHLAHRFADQRAKEITTLKGLVGAPLALHAVNQYCLARVLLRSGQ
jgi:hypothetical protein